jgi:hypothetical protein
LPLPLPTASMVTSVAATRFNWPISRCMAGEVLPERRDLRGCGTATRARAAPLGGRKGAWQWLTRWVDGALWAGSHGRPKCAGASQWWKMPIMLSVHAPGGYSLKRCRGMVPQACQTDTGITGRGCRTLQPIAQARAVRMRPGNRSRHLRAMTTRRRSYDATRSLLCHIS